MNEIKAMARISRLTLRVARIINDKIPQYTEAKDAKMVAELKVEVNRRELELAYLVGNFPEAAQAAARDIERGASEKKAAYIKGKKDSKAAAKQRALERDKAAKEIMQALES